jgi:hypothetical protein
MNFVQRFSFSVLLAISFFCIVRDVAGQAPSDKGTVLQLGPGVEIRVADPWVKSQVEYREVVELVVRAHVRLRPEPHPTDAQRTAEPLIEIPLARILITIEPRTSHEDALRRLDEIAASRPEPARFVNISGWPAVELEFQEPLSQRGQRAGPSADAVVTRARLAIAAGDQLVNFDVFLAPDAPRDLLRDGLVMARDISVPANPNPAAARQEIERLQNKESTRKAQPAPERRGMAPQEPTNAAGAPELDRVSEAGSAGTAVSVATGNGELEVAASRDAKFIVIATNSGVFFSTNRGKSFSRSSPGIFPPNDPSVTRAVSGNFYLDVIAFPNNLPGELGVSGCTNAVSRSTDNGANFALQGYSARCPATGTAICFPDQEHLAADPATAGNDQLYAVWRNFTPGAGTAVTATTPCQSVGPSWRPISMISCSQDNGVNWTAPVAIRGAGDFPRVALASDGSVYVTRLDSNNVMLNRLSSCATGLTQPLGFPVTVATLSGPVACPVSGLDRCGPTAGNTLESPTVAPDPDNAARVVVSFAERDGAVGERIVTRESTNNGVTFGPAATLSGNVSARRFMPWSCSTRGRAWVGWYDRTAATAPGATNDLTEYFVGVTNGTAVNLSQRPDPQCASGWPCAPAVPADATTCPGTQLAGRCLLPGPPGGGSGVPCNFSAPVCPGALETCQTGRGCPKYGDYNGLACAGNFVIAAWASATAPAGLSPRTGLSVYAKTMVIRGESLSPVVDFIAPVLDYSLRKEPDLTAVRYLLGQPQP